MILEGVSSLGREFRDYLSFGVYIDTPTDVCLERGLASDSGTGKPEAAIRALRIGWFECEDHYEKNDRPKEYADLVVDGTESFDKIIKQF
jgi:uridine kinase